MQLLGFYVPRKKSRMFLLCFSHYKESMMLILTRKEDQGIVIEMCGKKIEVVVTRTDSNKARIGIKAPLEANIVRAELLKKPGIAEPASC